jgi:hypothetical protein
LLKDFDRALDDFTKAIELRPGDPQAYASRAVCWYEKGAISKAWSDVEMCVKLGGKPRPGFLEELKKATR